MKIAVGPASSRLGERIAKSLNLETAEVIFKEFPDGETYVRVGGIGSDESVLLVQSMAPPQARNIMALLQMASAIRDCTKGRIVAIVPYLAFARQDRAFLEGEAVSAKVVARSMEANDVEELYVVEPHSDESLSWFRIPVVGIDPLQDLASFVQNFKERRIVVAPDKGRIEQAKKLSEILGTDYGWIEKERDRHSGQLTSRIGRLPDQKGAALLLDDIISTGGTIVRAATLLRSAGIQRIDVATIHGLFAQDGDKKIIQSGVSNIYASDTVEGKYSTYSVANSISRTLEKVVHDV